MNFSDSELVGGLLTEAGVEVVDNLDDADGILLNTCAIRENAAEKIFHRVKQIGYAKRKRPDLRVGILGCLAQNLKEELLDDSGVVDFLVGPDGYRKLPELLRTAGHGPRLETELSRTETYTDIPSLRKSGVNAWVTIMRGCDNFCTFCVVPYSRGRERSRGADDIVSEVEGLAEAGFRQVTLLGQNVNSYGAAGESFSSLMRRVCDVDGIDRVRFTSPHPKDFPIELLELLADHPSACPHIHLPLQSGSDAVLRRMDRGYTYSEYSEVVARIRKIVPGASITTDLIAGFCGETEDEFAMTLQAIEEVRYVSAFTFAYSERKNTIASRRYEDDLSREIKHQRVARMAEVQRRVSNEIHKDCLGTVVDVLVEGASRKAATEAFGRDPRGVGVVFPVEIVEPGESVRVRITDTTTNTLIGERLDQPLIAAKGSGIGAHSAI